jgi:hypothetical protein
MKERLLRSRPTVPSIDLPGLLRVLRLGTFCLSLLASMLLWSGPSRAAWVGGVVFVPPFCSPPDVPCPTIPPEPLHDGCITSGWPANPDFPMPLDGESAMTARSGAPETSTRLPALLAHPNGRGVGQRPAGDFNLLPEYSVECDTWRRACTFLANAVGNGDGGSASGDTGRSCDSTTEAPSVVPGQGGNSPILETITPYCPDSSGVDQPDLWDPAADTGCGPPPPTISQNGGSLWWFDGERPDETHYPTESTFMATDAAPSDPDTTYMWEITTGQDEAVFSENKGSTISTQVNTVKIKSIMASSISSGGSDISIQVTFRNSAGTSQPSESYLLTIRQPYQSISLSGEDSCVAANAAPSIGPLYVGYYCTVHYALLDQFQNQISGPPLLLNEEFTSDPVPDWTSPPNPRTENLDSRIHNCRYTDSTGLVVNVCFAQKPSDWADTLASAQPTGGSLYPPPVPPNSPLGQEKVVHWPGEWRFGSGTPGNGISVQTNTWQLYTDHGVHCDITSPTDGSGQLTSPCQ